MTSLFFLFIILSEPHYLAIWLNYFITLMKNKEVCKLYKNKGETIHGKVFAHTACLYIIDCL